MECAGVPPGTGMPGKLSVPGRMRIRRNTQKDVGDGRAKALSPREQQIGGLRSSLANGSCAGLTRCVVLRVEAESEALKRVWHRVWPAACCAGGDMPRRAGRVLVARGHHVVNARHQILEMLLVVVGADRGARGRHLRVRHAGCVGR